VKEVCGEESEPDASHDVGRKCSPRSRRAAAVSAAGAASGAASPVVPPRVRVRLAAGRAAGGVGGTTSVAAPATVVIILPPVRAAELAVIGREVVPVLTDDLKDEGELQPPEVARGVL
jgi:hypothetical protein